MRLIIELKRDAVAQVVLNQLFKHTQLQDNFGANMLALVDSVPRTLTLEQFLSYWVLHQIEVIQRRTRYRLRKAEERAHILSGYLKALDALDAVIALIRASATVDDARTGLIELLEIDEIQATAILDMQLRRLAALERQKIIDEYEDLMTKIADYNDILASDQRQRTIVSDELTEISDKFGDERRTEIVAWDGDVTDEDLIAVEDVVVTITSGGYAKRTLSDLYRSQRRGGRGVKGANLRQDDVVEHMFVSTTTIGSCSLPTLAGFIAQRPTSYLKPDVTHAGNTLPTCWHSNQMKALRKSWQFLTTPLVTISYCQQNLAW